MKRKMCVKIAQDVIAQLRLKRYKATRGTYVEIKSPELDSMKMKDFEEYYCTRDESFKDFFANNKKTSCNVCALGAAFISLVNIENKCSVIDMMHGHGMWGRLEKYFGKNNIDLMEAAFEGQALGNAGSKLSEAMLCGAVHWGLQYKNSEERLRAIMLNVIRNKGNFKPSKKYVARAKTAGHQ